VSNKHLYETSEAREERRGKALTFKVVVDEVSSSIRGDVVRDQHGDGGRRNDTKWDASKNDRITIQKLWASPKNTAIRAVGNTAFSWDQCRARI
jgi:hypothetical protein